MKIPEEHRRSAILLGILIAAYFTCYVFNAFLARVLGDDAYGDFSLLITIVWLGVPVILMGINSSALRFLPIMLANKEKPVAFSRWVRCVVRTSICITSCFGLLFVVHLVRFHHPGYLGGHYTGVTALFILLFAAPASLLSEIMRCFGKYYLTKFIFEFGQYALPLVICIVYYLLFGTFFFEQVMVILVISYLFIFVFQYYFVRKEGRRKWSGDNSKDDASEWFKSSVSMMASTFSMYALASVSMILLGILDEGTASVGHFNALLVIANMQFLIPKAVSIVFNTKISLSHKEGDKEKLQSLVSAALIFNLIIGGIIFISLCIAGKWLLATFGSSYIQYYNFLIAICFGHWLLSLAYNSASMLLYTPLYLEVVLTNVISLIISVIVGVVLILAFGFVGAVIGFISINVLSNLYKLYRVKKMLKIKPLGFI
jgi:O-antigen/teichoic acid export membrane protein